MALGVVALYLFVALIVTSLLRTHIGQRTWRAIHWASYAMWPIALLHGITAGSDAFAPWMLADRPRGHGRRGRLPSRWRITVGSPNRSRLADVVATSSWQRLVPADGR